MAGLGTNAESDFSTIRVLRILLSAKCMNSPTGVLLVQPVHNTTTSAGLEKEFEAAK